MTTFVNVPSSKIDELLASRGFTTEVKGKERVYTRTSKTNPSLRIVVYSSITDGADKARGVGKDAIRVNLLGKVGDREWCLHKGTRINRTGTVEGVIERIWGRVKVAADASKGYGDHPCSKCSAPTYADTGRCIVRACREGH